MDEDEGCCLEYSSTAKIVPSSKKDCIHALFILYPSRLYPVDKTRVNEFGQSFETEEVSKKKENKKKQ